MAYPRVYGDVWSLLVGTFWGIFFVICSWVLKQIQDEDNLLVLRLSYERGGKTFFGASSLRLF